MIKILMVCHGNICRSPMAEFVMKNMVYKAGLGDQFEIESAATSSEELGNPVYPPVIKILAQHGISVVGKRARQITRNDCEYFDYLIAMDRENICNMLGLYKEESKGKIHLLLDFTDFPRDVADPWYTRNFDSTWQDINIGCAGLLNKIKEDCKLKPKG